MRRRRSHSDPACVYLCSWSLPAFALIKHGVSCKPDPYDRLYTHATSRDNVLRARIGYPSLHWFASVTWREALAHETAIKRVARKLPRVKAHAPSFGAGPVGVVHLGYSNEVPSGEWLAHAPGIDEAGILRAWRWLVCAAGLEVST